MSLLLLRLKTWSVLLDLKTSLNFETNIGLISNVGDGNYCASDVMWCDVMWCDAMWCDVMRCDAMRCDMMWYDVMWCDVMWSDVMWCDAMRCDALRCDMMCQQPTHVKQLNQPQQRQLFAHSPEQLLLLLMMFLVMMTMMMFVVTVMMMDSSASSLAHSSHQTIFSSGIILYACLH